MRRIDRTEERQDVHPAPPASPGSAAPPAWIEIDHGAIRRNLARVRARMAPVTRLIAVVKANGYGHGATAVARTAAAAGADLLAVFSAADGAALRAAGIRPPILVLGPPAGARDAAIAVGEGLIPTVCEASYAREVAAAAARAATEVLPWPVHLKVDTGMSRFGAPAAAVAHLVDAIAALPALRLAGLYTHFAAIAAEEAPAIEAQLQAFASATRGVQADLRHACNSLAADLVPAAHLDAVRIGGAMYGLATGSPWLETAFEPALSLKARLVHVKRVPAGTAAGYGSTWRAPRPARLGLVPLGYADGVPRVLSNRGAVLVRGQRAPIAGMISMNQTIVDLSDVPAAEVGDEVVWVGRQGRQSILAAEVAAAFGGCAYEVTAGLRESLPRVHVGGS